MLLCCCTVSNGAFTMHWLSFLKYHMIAHVCLACYLVPFAKMIDRVLISIIPNEWDNTNMLNVTHGTCISRITVLISRIPWITITH